MAEFIGARISLISNSDIRYVGTLHEINAETSTVALENVTMLGTEGRRPDNEVAALDSIYEYILFRGRDVKDLRIEEAPTIKENKAPQIPNDPAILGSGSRPAPHIRSLNQSQPVSTLSQEQHLMTATQNTQAASQTGSSYGQNFQYSQHYPHRAGWGHSAPPGPDGFPTMSYSGNSAWYSGLQQSFPPGPQSTPYRYPSSTSVVTAQQQNTPNGKPIPIGAGASTSTGAGAGGSKPSVTSTPQTKKSTEPKNLPKAAEMPAAPVQKTPTPPATTNSNSNEIKLVNYLSNSIQEVTNADMTKSIPTGPKISGRVKPALPLRNISVTKEPLKSTSGNSNSKKLLDSPAGLTEATQAATAAVAAAIAKLPSLGVDNSMRGKEQPHVARNMRKQSRSSVNGDKINRGSYRAHGSRGGTRGVMFKVEVPTEDFDFESANAKFSKEDLRKEASAGSPIVKSGDSETSVKLEASMTYNKATSFFDNISSEVKDRQDTGNSKSSGREWRGEEQKKNLETFGQESIDNGYRGRGRGRGGYRSRGYNRSNHTSRGSTGYQNRRDVQTIS